MRVAIASCLAALADGIWRYRYAVVFASVVIISVLSAGLAKLRMDVDPEDLLGLERQSRVTYHAFSQDFGAVDDIILMVEADDVFSLKTLNTLRDLHETLVNELIYVDDVDSLINARMVYGLEDELIVSSLGEAWPRDQAELQDIAPRLASNSVFENLLYSEDHRFTVLVIRPQPPHRSSEDDAMNLLTTDETNTVVRALMSITEKFESPEFKIRIAGGPPTAFYVNNTMQEDMAIFTTMSILLILIFLHFLFRRVSGVIFPLIVIVATTTCTFGLMGWLGKPITAVSQILPSLLLAIGIGDSVHFLTLFYRNHTRENFERGMTRSDCIKDALEHCGLAMLLTTLTTMGGLLSFHFTEIVPIADFGVVAPIGVFIAFVLSMTLLPALVAIVPIEPVDERPSSMHQTERVLLYLSRASQLRPRITMALWLGIGAGAVYLALQVPLSYSPSKLLGDDHLVRQHILTANETLGWGTSVEIVVDSGEEEGVYNPRVLERIESIEQAAVTLQKNGMQAANSASIVDVVKEINRALHGNAPEQYRIPDSRQMVAQEFLLFRMSGSEDLERLVDDENRKARISLLVPEEDMSEFSGYLHALSDRVHNAAQGEVTVEITGIKTIEMETFDSLMTTVSTSYLIAFLVITPLMILVVGQFLQGIVFMLPNVLPIIVALGLMHVFGFPLDLLAIMIGSIAIGIAVDDTIHFNETYRSLRREGSDCQAALAQTVVSSGSAMLTTTAVLCAGFMVYCFASMEAVRHFGIITAICVGLAFLADITLAPAIVTLFDEQDET